MNKENIRETIEVIIGLIIIASIVVIPLSIFILLGIMWTGEWISIPEFAGIIGILYGLVITCVLLYICVEFQLNKNRWRQDALDRKARINTIVQRDKWKDRLAMSKAERTK